MLLARREYTIVKFSCKKKTRTAPPTVVNSPVPCTGVSCDERGRVSGDLIEWIRGICSVWGVHVPTLLE